MHDITLMPLRFCKRQMPHIRSFSFAPSPTHTCFTKSKWYLNAPSQFAQYRNLKLPLFTVGYPQKCSHFQLSGLRIASVVHHFRPKPCCRVSTRTCLRLLLSCVEERLPERPARLSEKTALSVVLAGQGLYGVKGT